MCNSHLRAVWYIELGVDNSAKVHEQRRAVRYARSPYRVAVGYGWLITRRLPVQLSSSEISPTSSVVFTRRSPSLLSPARLVSALYAQHPVLDHPGKL